MENEIRKHINQVKTFQSGQLNKPEHKYTFTEDDIDNCWQYYKSYLVDILNGDYKIEDAREDLYSLIGSEYDRRTAKN